MHDKALHRVHCGRAQPSRLPKVIKHQNLCGPCVRHHTLTPLPHPSVASLVCRPPGINKLVLWKVHRRNMMPAYDRIQAVRSEKRLSGPDRPPKKSPVCPPGVIEQWPQCISRGFVFSRLDRRRLQPLKDRLLQCTGRIPVMRQHSESPVERPINLAKRTGINITVGVFRRFRNPLHRPRTPSPVWEVVFAWSRLRPLNERSQRLRFRARFDLL